MPNDKKPKAPEPEAAPKAPKKSPVSEHAAAAYPAVAGGRVVDGVRSPHPEFWKHAAAAALHQWAAYAHHNNGEFELTADDYASAIEAACTLNAKGIPTPHKAALGAVKA